MGGALLTIALCPPVAFLAGYSRGVLAPLGFVIITMILAQFSGVLGLGPYFPWAIPGLFSISDGSADMQLHCSGYLILAFTSMVGLLMTVRWWRFADHK
jgi:ABC-2 type transport system permease protein